MSIRQPGVGYQDNNLFSFSGDWTACHPEDIRTSRIYVPAMINRSFHIHYQHETVIPYKCLIDDWLCTNADPAQRKYSKVIFPEHHRLTKTERLVVSHICG